MIGLGVVWAATWLSGLGSSTHAGRLVTDGRNRRRPSHTVVRDLNDRSVFAAQIKQDPVAQHPKTGCSRRCMGKTWCSYLLRPTVRSA